jgi:hypothetical protein
MLEVMMRRKALRICHSKPEIYVVLEVSL